MRATQGCRRVGRGEIDFMAMVVAKLEQRGADLQALGALHEAPPIGTAAKLPIGDDLKTGLLLHANRGAHAVVLNADELVLADLAAGAAAERLAQRRRAQQAADVIGTKRRTAVRTQAHAWSLLNSGLLSIAQ